jgi:hypothetical protein
MGEDHLISPLYFPTIHSPKKLWYTTLTYITFLKTNVSAV